MSIPNVADNSTAPKTLSQEGQMFRKIATFIFLLMIPFTAMSCASYKITKNPDDCNKGIRYYRPKPYLYVGPSKIYAQNGAPMVQVSIEYLPDYEEEYAIEVNPGLGTTSLNVTLADGWNLTGFQGQTDQKYAEILGSLASVMTAAGGLAKPAMAAAPAYETGDGEPVKIDAPFGYYESVFWHDACGKKHLYGWRYIGFMPFNSCPVQACPNIHDAHCDDPDQFWALIPTSGASLQFIRIGDLKSGKGQSSRNIIPDTESAPPPPADAPATAPAPKPAANRRHVEDEVGVGIRPARHSRTRVQLGPASARGQGEPIMRQ